MRNNACGNRKPNRLPEFDYSQNGYYLVTICAHDHIEWFGKIENGEMKLNGYGAIAAIHWQGIPNHYHNVELDEWIIMPNHIHGIIVLSPVSVGTAHCAVPTKPVSLSQIIKSFKDVTTKRIRSEFGDVRFAWQRSFHDHVIRNEYALMRMREYILNNPKQWELDAENPARRGRAV